MEKIIIYGAGQAGQKYYRLLEKMGYSDDVVAFCDQKHDEIENLFGLPVISYEDAKKEDRLFLIGVSSRGDFYNQIRILLENDMRPYYSRIDDYLFEIHNIDKGVTSRELVLLNFETCHYDYYENAEKENFLSKYWDTTSPFFKCFEKLDVTNVVELACGHGRHVPKYISKSHRVTLVEYNEECVSFCRKRFINDDRIVVYKNNGKDLSILNDNNYTALFTYDSFPQFEMMNVFGYLQESYRILQNGGRALFHHSNYHDDYTCNFAKPNNMGGRCFMSDKLFAYLACRVGFSVLDQIIVDANEPNLDCITLVEKKIQH